jgi:hypothetical protein
MKISTKNIFAFMVTLSVISIQLEAQLFELDQYNVVWKSQSKSSIESMPCGGGDIGLNVWVENGDLLFYISQSGTFDENNQMLKHGRVRIKLRPNPFENGDKFSQELKIHDGCVRIKGTKGDHNVEMEVWVDVFHPVVHIETQSNIPITVESQYETWRTEDLEIPLGLRDGCFSYSGFTGKVVTYKDQIVFDKDNVEWFHRNKEDKLLFDFVVNQQGLNKVKEQLFNSQKGRTFGGVMTGKGMHPNGTESGIYASTPFIAWKLKSEEASKSNDIKIYLNTCQSDSLENWKDSLLELVTSPVANSIDAKQKTFDWWHRFWERSYISINVENGNPQDSVWQVGRNYQLFRYMLGCNAYGKYPSKFNGSLFTVDPVYIRNGEYDWTPDFRAWGGGSFTAQNQRLVYWPLLKSGDFDMMVSQFDYYKNALPSAEARTKVYWGHEGCSFTEQLENFGLPFAGGWGFESGHRKRDLQTEFGVQSNAWVSYHYVNQLEFSLMILDYYRFSGKEINTYLPFIKSSVKFFDEHYQYRNKQLTGEPLDDGGKLVFYPSTAGEMYKLAKNPVDVIAALQTILPRLAELPGSFVSKSEKKYYRKYIQRIPDIPFDIKEGHKVIKPAESWREVRNQEIPELYAVFPYNIYGIGKPNLDLARDTWYYGESREFKKFTVCWSQVGIFASRLGLTDEAASFVVGKLADSDHRFPAFWGPGPDWVPDIDHGGAGMINLQEMLIQTDDEKIYLLPAWPKEWDVSFKLHAPYSTTVECVYKNGKIELLNVTPESRKKNVQVL